MSCDARTRGKTPCKKPNGWGTNHVGQGRCKLHGGATPIKHGRYSKIVRPRLQELIQQHAADPDPLNIEQEIAALRALFEDACERNADTCALAGILSDVTRAVERLNNIRTKAAITREQLTKFLLGLDRVLETRIADKDLLARVRDDMLAVPL